MTSQNIAHLRLQAQMIAAQQFTNPADVVRHLGAVQAQDYGQALWAVGSRTKGATRATIEQAIADGTILRTWPMRGTIHFVPAQDAAWMLSIAEPRIIAGATGRKTHLAISDAIVQRAGDVLEEALTGHKTLDRAALLEALELAGIDTSEQRGYHLLWHWSQLGRLCIGPMNGKKQTFALLREWAPNQRELPREEAIVELARRYFKSHGPATLADFCWWTGMLRSEAKSALERLKSELEVASVAGVDYWFAPDIPAAPKSALADAYLLAGFEEYLLGYKDRSAVLASEFTATSYKNGIFFPIIVADGQVLGTWKRIITPKKITVRFEPFTELSSEVQERCRHKVLQYGHFMNQPIDILS